MATVVIVAFLGAWAVVMVAGVVALWRDRDSARRRRRLRSRRLRREGLTG